MPFNDNINLLSSTNLINRFISKLVFSWTFYLLFDKFNLKVVRDFLFFYKMKLLKTTLMRWPYWILVDVKTTNFDTFFIYSIKLYCVFFVVCDIVEITRSKLLLLKFINQNNEFLKLFICKYNDIDIIIKDRWRDLLSSEILMCVMWVNWIFYEKYSFVMFTRTHYNDTTFSWVLPWP